MFGSARIEPAHWVYGAVHGLAAALAQLGSMVITRGGPGLMRAASRSWVVAPLLICGSVEFGVGWPSAIAFAQLIGALSLSVNPRS
jgi:predicted Rossmann-fold nucleotide-binding protein